MSTSTSSLYKELTQEEIDELIQKHFSEKRFEYSLLKGGLFNTTYLVTLTATKQKFVLRLGPVNRHLILPFEISLMNGEKYFYDLCNDTNIPMSKVVVCNTTKDIIDRDYMIVECIEGTAMSLLEMPKADKDILYEKVGEYAAQIHGIKGAKFGRLSHITEGIGFSKWSEYLKAEIAEWQEFVKKTGVFASSDLTNIDAIFDKYESVLDEITKPCLIHADLWEGNVLVCNENDKYKVSAIIDGDRAIFGDIDYEFASGWMINDSFMQGYGDTINMSQNNVIRRKIYSLIFHLTDAYICRAEYHIEPDVVMHRNASLQLIDELLKA